MPKFLLKLIAPDGVKYEAEAEEVILPTVDGQIQVLPDHMPLVTLLSPGEIVIKNGADIKYLETDGGIVEIDPKGGPSGSNLVKILADSAETADSLDGLKIEEARKAAEQRLTQAKDEVEFAEAQALLEKQLAKLKFIKRRKHS